MPPPSVSLERDDSPSDHPCASTVHYGRDLALMNYLLQDMRSLVRAAAAGRRRVIAHERIEWDVHDLHRRTIVCEPEAILAPVDMWVVGFFSDRRGGVDRAPLHRAEDQLIEELHRHPGMLSYSSMELVDDHWANLVIHAAPPDRERWRESEVHGRAVVDLAPLVYNSVRIHRGCVAGGVLGSDTVVIESSQYWCYQQAPPWHAERMIRGGLDAMVAHPLATKDP